MDKYGVDTEQQDGKTASDRQVSCPRPNCPDELDVRVNPPKCVICGYEYLQRQPNN